MSEPKKRCHMCEKVWLGGATWKTTIKIDPVTRERSEIKRCPDCDVGARTGLSIHAKPDALAESRKRGNKNSPKQGRPRLNQEPFMISVGRLGS